MTTPATTSTAADSKPADFAITTGDLALMLSAVMNAELSGDADLALTGIEPLEHAGPGDLSFVRSQKFAERLGKSGAGALLVTRGVTFETDPGRPVLTVDDADRALMAILTGVRERRFGPIDSGVHPTAVVHPSAELHESVTVGANAVIEARVRIGANTDVHAGAIIMAGSTIGERCVVGPRVTIGFEGFSYLVDDDGVRTHLPHVGAVTIGDDVEIGAGSCIDRGKLRDTVIGRGTKIDNLVQIAHNCEIGEDVVICALCGLAGSAKIGDRAVLAGQVGVGDNVFVAPGSTILAQSGVTRSVKEPDYYYGTPIQTRAEYARQYALLRKLARAKLEDREERKKNR